MYIADTENGAIRKVDINGVISTYAGSYSGAAIGDGLDPLNAFIGGPLGLYLRPNGDLIFAVYDANQRDKLVHLRYRASDETFQFDKTWYYPGGLVTAMKLYVSPIM